MSIIGKKYIHAFHMRYPGESLRAPEVQVTIKVYSINRIDVTGQCFNCTLMLMLDWIDESVIGRNHIRDWLNHFIPVIDVDNASHNESKRAKHHISKITETMRIKNKDNGHCTLTIKYSLEFVQIYRVMLYPFDRHVLSVKLKARKCLEENIPIFFSVKQDLRNEYHKLHPVLANLTPEWSIRSFCGHPAPHHWVDKGIRMEISDLKATHDLYFFHIFIRREWKNAAFNIFSGLLICDILVFSQFFVEKHDAAARAGIILALVLAVMAFKLFIADTLPKVPYLTICDLHVLGCFTFLLLQAVLIGIVRTVYKFELEWCLGHRCANITFLDKCNDCIAEISSQYFPSTAKANQMAIACTLVIILVRYVWLLDIFRSRNDLTESNNLYGHGIDYLLNKVTLRCCKAIHPFNHNQMKNDAETRNLAAEDCDHCNFEATILVKNEATHRKDYPALWSAQRGREVVQHSEVPTDKGFSYVSPFVG